MWKKVEYSKKAVNRAGKKIIDPNITQEERKECLKIIDNWRAAHAYPMNTFAINLKHQVADIPDAVVVQRLKRLDTILKKIERFPRMELARMQDFGGCRVIVPEIQDVYKVVNGLRGSRIRHKEHNHKDYIKEPEKTGYRGYHLIYKYMSDKKEDYNGLMVEIQVRTHLQHLWSTAVETVGVFTGNGLKFNQGSEDWLRFFALVSGLFAIKEEQPLPPNIPGETMDILEEFVELNNKLNAIEKLYTIGVAIKIAGHIQNQKQGYYLLILNTKKNTLSVKYYQGKEKALQTATNDYNSIEKNGNDDINAVLVSAESYENLILAYPNYFADITKFTETLIEITNSEIDKYQTKQFAEMS